MNKKNLRQKVFHNLNENVFHSIGDKIDNGGSSFLKGLLAGGIGLAAFSDPETANHVKEAISGTAHNIGNFLGLTDDNQHVADSNVQHAVNGNNEHGGALSKILNHNSTNVANLNQPGFQVNPNDPKSVMEFLNKYRDYTKQQAEYWHNAAKQFSPDHQIVSGFKDLLHDHPIATSTVAGLAATGLGYAGYNAAKNLKKHVQVDLKLK